MNCFLLAIIGTLMMFLGCVLWAGVYLRKGKRNMANLFTIGASISISYLIILKPINDIAPFNLNIPYIIIFILGSLMMLIFISRHDLITDKVQRVFNKIQKYFHKKD